MWEVVEGVAKSLTAAGIAADRGSRQLDDGWNLKQTSGGCWGCEKICRALCTRKSSRSESWHSLGRQDKAQRRESMSTPALPPLEVCSGRGAGLQPSPILWPVTGSSPAPLAAQAECQTALNELAF